MMFRLAIIALVASSTIVRADDSLFREKVLPILERKCVGCHSDTNPKGKLSMATAVAFRRGGEEGPTIEPGKPDESLLIEKVEGPKPSMPKTGTALSAGEVASLRQWIESGAIWPDGVVLKDRKFDGQTWWSLQPLQRPEVPETTGWTRNPIDSFILLQLRKNHLSPSVEADRRILIRRVTFDLIGLPPTSEQIEAYLSDTSAEAYEHVVDRLLKSPEYGERWARHWLDLAHFGDTHGYDKDKRRDHAWPYRDYVIAAFNQDTPYARFIQEQLAGDVLFPNDSRGVVATGFIAAGPWDFVGNVELREGTVDKDKTRLIDRDDMVTTAISSFASLTVHCARCHDHKFDPIPQRDYYRLQAVFAGVDRGDRPFDDSESVARRTELDARAKSVQFRRAELFQSIGDLKLRAEIERRLAPRMADSPTNGYHSGIETVADATKWVQVDLGRSIALESIHLVPARPTDFADTPGFGFPSRYRVELADEPTFRSPQTIASRDDSNPGNQTVIIPVSGQTKARYLRVTATKLWKRTNDYVFALGELQAMAHGENIAIGAEVSALDSIEGGRWGRSHLVDGYDSRQPLDTPSRSPIDDALRSRLATSLGKVKADAIVAQLDQSTRELAMIASDRATIPPSRLVYAILPHAPRPIAVLSRGEVEHRGEIVGAGALSCITAISSTFGDPSTNEGDRRIGLARWLIDPANPLTWRSIVNRVWHYHFGRGIVDTPSDFGRNGSLPTHPELLDWLAVSFRDGGGSFKALHRLIVTSATYRQSANDRPEAAAIDGDNRLLWRRNRSRLDAEEVRDSVLFVAGTLDPQRGGPGFEPFFFKDDHSPIYDHTDTRRALAPECRRRSIYRFTVRSVPHPFLDCMDSADPNINVPVRSTTITALQALALWNDPFMMVQADAMAKRVAGSTTEVQVDRAVRLALGRPSRPQEAKELADLARKRGMATVCRLLFNTNEFLFIE